MDSKRNIYFLRFFLIFPILVLTFSYFYLCFEYNKLNVFFEIIHENKKYTLVETIFYFDHFVREIVICVMMALSIASAFYMFSPLKGNINLHLVEKIFKLSLFLALFLALGSVIGATVNGGIKSTLLNLFQFKTTDILTIYGSHWNFHLLHVVFVQLVTLSLSFFYRGYTGLSCDKRNKNSLLYLGIWVLLFLLFTVIFIPSLKPFSDTRYLAHQFREIVTHLTVTIPLAFAFLIFVESKLIQQSFSGNHSIGLIKKAVSYFFYTSLIPVFILIQLQGRDIMSAAQKKSSYLDLLAAHYFEHMIDYFFVAFLSVVLYTLFVWCFNERKTSQNQ